MSTRRCCSVVAFRKFAKRSNGSLCGDSLMLQLRTACSAMLLDALHTKRISFTPTHLDMHFKSWGTAWMLSTKGELVVSMA